MSSDGDVIVHAKWLAERSGLIKHEEEGLYRELLAISGNQLQRVLRAEPRPSRDDEGNWVPYTAAHWEWTTQEARRALARIGELLAEARPATRNGADGPPASAAPGPSRRL